MPSCGNSLRCVSGRTTVSLCDACVYFSRNLDHAAYPVPMDGPEQCGIGFRPGDAGCAEMRSDNCSMRRDGR